MLDQLRPMTQQGAQRNQVGVGTEGLREQAQTVQRLNPLTIEPVGLVAGGEAVSDVAADQATVDAALLQHLEQGDPINTGGFHRYRLDAVLDQPGGEGVQVGGIGAEGAHDLGLVGTGMQT